MEDEEKVLHVEIIGEGTSAIFRMIYERISKGIENWEYQTASQTLDANESNLVLTEDQLLSDNLATFCNCESNKPSIEPTIDQLKKQIKYSKNSLEVKMLNRQLNKIYKTMKGVK